LLNPPLDQWDLLSLWQPGGENLVQESIQHRVLGALTLKEAPDSAHHPHRPPDRQYVGHRLPILFLSIQHEDASWKAFRQRSHAVLERKHLASNHLASQLAIVAHVTRVSLLDAWDDT
jgi:hypothetical protein